MDTNTIDPATRREWFAAHAAKLAACLETPFSDKQPSQIWRTMFDRDGVTWIAAIFRTQGQQSACRVWFPGAIWLCNFPDDDTVDARELAAWLGLETIDPDSVTWRQQKRSGIIQAMRGAPLPVDFKTLRSN